MRYQSIIFSGLPGAGKSTLVAKIAEIYKMPIFSVGELWRAKWRKLHPGGEVSFEEYWRTTSTEENLQVNIDYREDALKRNFIGDSRYAIYMRDLPVLLVFLSAELEVRARRGFGLEKYKGKSVDEIKKILCQREVDEVSFSKRLYNYDYRDSAYYHISLNTGMLSQEEEITIIKGLMPPGIV
ncbi:MAG: AAA family ATPase [Candidatus Pacebacteria bacterium]|jgi:cytidylate kinase|nr:AAA family ATPase [Candidatus Paceibacterota bacterium]